MNFALILRVLSVLLIIVSVFMLLSGMTTLFYGEEELLGSFLLPFVVATTGGAVILFLTRRTKAILSHREALLLVALSWASVSAIGALPAWLSGAISSYTDAFFETMSGFTTTGASILSNIEGVPYSILFWRSVTHWLGGMGIIVLTVAVFPLLGFRGLQLVKAEAPWPTVDKITPRITHTAKILWLIYLGMTILQTILLLFGGMNLFDALTHTFGTLATGGFSPKNSSVGAFDSPYVDAVITVFMLMAGINFILYFKLITGRIRSVLQDTELRAYLLIFLLATAVTTVSLHGNVFPQWGSSLRYAAFQAASILTTTGFVTADYDLWPSLARSSLFLLMFVGGCAGSTGGGIKVVRIVTLFKQSLAEMKLLVRPHGVYTLRMNGLPLRRSIVLTIASFVFLYIFLLLLTTVVVAAHGVSVFGSFATALATLGNIGPGFMEVGPVRNYAFLPDGVKWFLSFIMMTGRLEVFTVLTIFTPAFWKR